MLFNTGTGYKYLDVMEPHRAVTQKRARLAGDWRDYWAVLMGSIQHSVQHKSFMTERLYYRDTFLYEFDGKVVEVVGPTEQEPRTGMVLDRTAFYPTSGGQVHDLGHLRQARSEVAIKEVADLPDGRVVHFVESPALIEKGNDVHGIVDAVRRRDHMQQHSGQHVLSAAFVKLFQIPTVSFHMGEEAVRSISTRLRFTASASGSGRAAGE